MSWDILPKDVQGVIISNLDFNEFSVLCLVNRHFLNMSLQFLDCKDIATGDFCHKTYEFMFNLTDNIKINSNYDDLRLMLRNFLKNESIPRICFINGLFGYKSRSDNCCLNEMYNIILKRLSSNVTNDEINTLLKLYKEMIINCTIDFDNDLDNAVKVKPTLSRMKMISDFINNYVETKHEQNKKIKLI